MELSISPISPANKLAHFEAGQPAGSLVCRERTITAVLYIKTDAAL
jgi:hypothetical protein